MTSKSFGQTTATSFSPQTTVFSHTHFSPLVLQPPWEIRWGRNFFYLWIQDFWTSKIKWNVFCWNLLFVLQTFFSFHVDQHECKLSRLSWVCASCLLIKLFSQKFYFFIKVEKKSFFFHFACMLPEPARFENSCAFLLFCVKILRFWWNTVLLQRKIKAKKMRVKKDIEKQGRYTQGVLHSFFEKRFVDEDV